MTVEQSAPVVENYHNHAKGHEGKQSLDKDLPRTCEVLIPQPDDQVDDFVKGRWNTLFGSSLPAAIVRPSSEDDVVAVVQFAAAEGLRVFPTAGGHNGGVTLDKKTIYLDLRRLKGVEIDEGREVVTVQGGATWGDVKMPMINKGLYRAFGNHDTVGVIGSLLGGGLNHYFQGTGGWGIDSIVSLRAVIGAGTVVDLSHQSTGADKELFNMFCGGGPGLGIITSITLRAFKIADLGLTDGDKLYSLTAAFMPEKLEKAIDLFQKFSPSPDPTLTTLIGFLTAPPPMPIAGQSLLLMKCYSVASKDYTEKLIAPMLAPDVAEAALMPPGLTGVGVPHADDEAQAIVANLPPGSRDIFNCLLRRISPETIRALGEHWQTTFDQNPDRARGRMLALTAWPNSYTQRFDPEGKLGFDFRDRNYMVQVLVSGVPLDDREGLKEAEAWGAKVVEIARRDDDADGVQRRVWFSSARTDTKIEELHTPEKLKLFRDLKAKWDPQNVVYVAN